MRAIGQIVAGTPLDGQLHRRRGLLGFRRILAPVYSEEGTRWRATPIFGALGVETVHIVKANALGERLIAYYRKIVQINEQQRRRFKENAEALPHIDLLHGDYSGIEIGNLPKGLDSLAKVTVRVV